MPEELNFNSLRPEQVRRTIVKPPGEIDPSAIDATNGVTSSPAGSQEAIETSSLRAPSLRRNPIAGVVASAGGGNDDIFDKFDKATAADDLGPLPRGIYVVKATKGEITTAKTGNRGYTVEFLVLDGDHSGRRLWKTWYFTEAAMEYTKRDLQKFGLYSKAEINAPFPANRLVFKVTVVVRKDDDGFERNEVKKIEFLRREEPATDPFAPLPEVSAQ